MGYYDDKKNVEQYIEMAEGYDGKFLISALTQHLPEDSHVLELGIGPGKDLLLLGEHYQVTGSDFSAIFVERFRKQYPDIDVMQLDAVTMDTDKTFDGIYSNKVLYHLSRDDLKTSFENQAKQLKSGGIALHSFWFGDEESEHQGLRFVYYTEETIKQVIGEEYEIVTTERYSEMDADDSFYIILRRQ